MQIVNLPIPYRFRNLDDAKEAMAALSCGHAIRKAILIPPLYLEPGSNVSSFTKEWKEAPYELAFVFKSRVDRIRNTTEVV